MRLGAVGPQFGGALETGDRLIDLGVVQFLSAPDQQGKSIGPDYFCRGGCADFQRSDQWLAIAHGGEQWTAPQGQDDVGRLLGTMEQGLVCLV